MAEIHYVDRQKYIRGFSKLAKNKNQPKSWLMDEALEDLLSKNGIKVQKAGDAK